MRKRGVHALAANETELASPRRELPPALAAIARTGAALLEDAEAPIEWVVENVIEDESLVLLTGREKLTYKTMLCCALTIARIVGCDWLGFGVHKHKEDGAVLFVSCETSTRSIGRRIKALCKAHRIDPRKVFERLVVVGQPITMITRERRDVVAEQAFTAARASALRAPRRTEDDVRRAKILSEGAEFLARAKVRALGQNLDALRAVEDAEPGTFSLIILDTLRTTLHGDDNSSQDVREYMQAARELARRAGCPIVVVHHNNKAGNASDARSARGSTEITGAPDALLTIDPTGENPTMHFTLRDHPAPAPRGYAVVSDADEMRIELREVSEKVASDGITGDDVLAAFDGADTDGLTTDSIRRRVSAARGGAPGSKAPDATIKRCIDALVKRGALSPCEVKKKNGQKFPAWRLGAEGGEVPAVRVRPVGASAPKGNVDPFDVDDA